MNNLSFTRLPVIFLFRPSTDPRSISEMDSQRAVSRCVVEDINSVMDGTTKPGQIDWDKLSYRLSLLIAWHIDAIEKNRAAVSLMGIPPEGSFYHHLKGKVFEQIAKSEKAVAEGKQFHALVSSYLQVAR